MQSRHESLNLPPGVLGRSWLHQGFRGRLRMHRHDDLEFNLVTAGRAAYLLEDRRVELQIGSLIWLYPEQGHVLIDQSPDFGMWVVVFRPELVQSACQGTCADALAAGLPSGPTLRVLEAEACSELHAVLSRITEQRENLGLVNTAAAYLLQLAWLRFQEAKHVEDGVGVDPVVRQVARSLRDHAEAVNLDELAEDVGLTASTLSRLFQRQMGVSLTHYRQRCCLDRLLSLYGEGNRMNLTEAALTAGFGSYAQFHRVFKQQLGFSPAEYRRRLHAREVGRSA